MMVWAKTGPVLLAFVGIAASVKTSKRYHFNYSPNDDHYNHFEDSTTNNALAPYRYVETHPTEIPRIASSLSVEKKIPFSLKALEPAVAVTLDRSATIAIPTTLAKPMTATAAAVPLVAPFPISLDEPSGHFPVKFFHPVMSLHQPLLVTKFPIIYQGTFPHLDGTLRHHSQNFVQPYQ